MRHKIFKKLSLLYMMILVAATIFLPNTLVYGATGEESLYEDVVEVSDTSTVLTRGNFLNYGTVTMSKDSPTRVLISGMTVAHRTCDTLGLDLYLEKSSDGVNFTSYRQFTNENHNQDILYQTIKLIVPDGYWYRLSGVHVAIVGNDGESVTTLTEPLYI